MRRNYFAREARAFATNAPLAIGALALLAIGAVALFGPAFAPYDPHAWRLVEFYPGGEAAIPPIRPGPYHWLGTDAMGRDILSRLLWGARLTLAGVLLAVVGRALLGTAVGLLAAWRRGPIDAVVRRALDALAGFPQLMAALLLVVVLKDLGLLGFAVALSLVGWAEIAQFVRAEALRLRVAPFVEAAQSLGARTRHVALHHVARNLAPQLAGLLALEAGSVLVLLAELGFIGFFISGGTFFVGDDGRPVLPVRDRAPEWGQMLAGARAHTFTQQWVAFIPALVVGAAAVGFNLFGEGLRAAIDPFGRHRLSPRTLGALARGFGAVVFVGALGFGWTTLRSLELSIEDGARLAHEAAARVSPGSDLVAIVVRFDSRTHALARPEKLNYYFRAPSGETLRVGFVGADANATEVKRFDDEDRFDDLGALRALGEWRVRWQDALAAAERRGGTGYRNRAPAYVVRVTLEQRASSPQWRVRYAPGAGSQATVDIPVDARTGETRLPFATFLSDAEERARTRLGLRPQLIGLNADWWSDAYAATQAGGPHPDGQEFPVTVRFTYAVVDPTGRRGAVLIYDARSGLAAATRGFAIEPTATSPSLRPLPQVDLHEIFRRVEDAGGRALRGEWERQGLTRWQVHVSLGVREARAVADAFYSVAFATAPARFRLDLDTGAIERVPVGAP